MYKAWKAISFLCETPLHAGSGSSLGVVDLPIQRERHTEFPKIESSSLKGSIREAFEVQTIEISEVESIVNKINITDLVFGPEDGEGDKHAGALALTDAKILLFPVKSAKGVFAWITCPMVLERLTNDLKLINEVEKFKIPQAGSVTEKSDLVIEDLNGTKSTILEEFTFVVKEDEECTKFAKWISENVMPQGEEHEHIRKWILKKLIVISNDDFTDFVKLSTEVITRIKINNETGTVAKGGLFTEEFLPSDSVLYSVAIASPLFLAEKNNDQNKRIKEFVHKNYKLEEEFIMNSLVKYLPRVIQLGGDRTHGKGILTTKFIGKEESK